MPTNRERKETGITVQSFYRWIGRAFRTLTPRLSQRVTGTDQVVRSQWPRITPKSGSAGCWQRHAFRASP